MTRPSSARSDLWTFAAIVLIHGWPLALLSAGLADAGQALFYYWMEFAAAGVFGLARIAAAVRVPLTKRAQTFALSGGFFALMAGLLFITLIEGFAIRVAWSAPLIWSAVFLAGMETTLFLTRFVLAGEYRKADVEDLAGALLARSLGMYALVSSIAFVCYNLGAIDLAPYVLVALRAAVDVLAACRRQRA